jgi:hypothetical protein
MNYNHNRTLSDTELQLQDLFSALTDTAHRYVQALPVDVFALDELQQTDLVDKINPYFRFELGQYPNLHNLTLHATGTGMMFLSDLDGNVMGAETMTDDDVVTGDFTDVCVLPTPTIECLLAQEGESIPIVDQVLSPIIILENGRLKTGKDAFGNFQTEHDLSNFQVCLPLAHYLKIAVDRP